MDHSRELVEQSRRVVTTSRDNARLARQRIERTRELLSGSSNRVVLSASTVTAARWSAR